MSEQHQLLEQRVKRMEDAIFGNGSDRPGMAKQMEEMYELFTQTSGTARFMFRFLVAAGTLAAAVLAIWRVIVEIRK